MFQILIILFILFCFVGLWKKYEWTSLKVSNKKTQDYQLVTIIYIIVIHRKNEYRIKYVGSWYNLYGYSCSIIMNIWSGSH